jgi:hypothetical protein
MTTTTQLTQASAETLALLQLEQEAASCAGVLPYWPIWAAAQFASTDEMKQILQFVHIWRDGDAYQIESTDGHRAFRYRFPVSTTESAGAGTAYLPTLWRIPEGGLLLHAKPLKKAVSYSKLLTVTEDLRAVFHGGKKQALLELSSVNLSGFYGVNTASKGYTVGAYPKINQLWPDRFTNQPGKQFAFDARYLREWCSVVEKLSERGITKTVCNSPTTPFVFSCNYQRCIGQHFEDAALELLLMPVQIRD